jgi:hypothetical protein
MGPVYTMDEVAEHLRKSRRWLQDFLHANPGCYFLAGRTKLFSQRDVAKIEAILRASTPCPSSFSRQRKAGRRSTASAVATSVSVLTEALRLATEH